MKTGKTLLLSLAILFISNVAWGQQQTVLQHEAFDDCVTAFLEWDAARSYYPSNSYTRYTLEYSRLAYLKSVYTYYGYNIRPGGGNPMTSYDCMWAWASTARDADLAYRWFASGMERGGIAINKRSVRILQLLWAAKQSTQAAADEALEYFYDNYEF